MIADQSCPAREVELILVQRVAETDAASCAAWPGFTNLRPVGMVVHVSRIELVVCQDLALSINDCDAKSSAVSMALNPALQKIWFVLVRQGFGKNQSCRAQTIFLLPHVVLVNAASQYDIDDQQDRQQQEHIRSHDL